MRTQIENVLNEEGKISLGQIAKKLDVDYMEVLNNAPNSKRYPVEKLEELFDIFRSWEKVFLLVITENFVLEISDKFPVGFKAHGFLNFHDKTTSIGGHLTTDNISSIYIVDDVMFGRRSCSFKFYDKDNKEIFAIYLPRDEKKELISSPLEDFERLFNN